MRFNKIVVDVEKMLGNLKFTKSRPKDRYGFPGQKDYVVTLYSDKIGETFDVVFLKEVNFEPDTPVELVGEVTLKVSAVELKQGELERIDLLHKISAEDIKRKGSAVVGNDKK